MITEAVLYRMQQTACELSELLIVQEEISEKVNLMKGELIRYAEENGVSEKMDLGKVVIFPTQRQKTSLDNHLVTPDWLYRYREQGGRFEFKPKLEKSDGSHFDDLLREVAYEVELVPGWTIKRK